MHGKRDVNMLIFWERAHLLMSSILFSILPVLLIFHHLQVIMLRAGREGLFQIEI